MSNPYQEWFDAFQESIVFDDALAIACDWLTDRDLDDRVFRDYLAKLDSGAKIVSADPELHKEWLLKFDRRLTWQKRVKTVVSGPVGPFYRCTLYKSKTAKPGRCLDHVVRLRQLKGFAKWPSARLITLENNLDLYEFLRDLDAPVLKHLILNYNVQDWAGALGTLANNAKIKSSVKVWNSNLNLTIETFKKLGA